MPQPVPRLRALKSNASSSLFLLEPSFCTHNLARAIDDTHIWNRCKVPPLKQTAWLHRYRSRFGSVSGPATPAVVDRIARAENPHRTRAPAREGFDAGQLRRKLFAPPCTVHLRKPFSSHER